MLGHHQRLQRVRSHIEEGGVELGPKVLEIVHQALAQLEVEPDKRIIQDEYIRVLQNAARDRGTLLLAAGELARPLLKQRRYVQHLGGLAHAGDDLGARHALQLHRIGYVVEHAHMGEQREGLGHIADRSRGRR